MNRRGNFRWLSVSSGAWAAAFFLRLNAAELIAHRGGYEFGPENTIVNARHCLRHGATTVEIDLRRTWDREIIVIHDETVDRTTDGTGRVGDLTLEEIRDLDVGSWWSPQFAGAQVPTLTEMLVAIREENGKACLDLKEEGMAEDIRSKVDDVGFAQESIFFLCYTLTQSADCARWLPRAHTLVILGGKPTDLDASVYQRFRDNGASGLMFWHGVFSKEEIAYSHAHGFEVHAMGGSKQYIWDQIDSGVDGFGTDGPELCSRQYRADAWQRWVQDAGLSQLPEASREAIADPDGDGLANLLEYALGSAPSAPTSFSPQWQSLQSGASGSVVARYRFAEPALPHLQVVPSRSFNLENWERLPGLRLSPDLHEFEIPLNFEKTEGFLRLEVKFWP
ncbi:MAG: glycerophosphodiester phosphodiesterase [Verrucomicrobiales bacterium]